MTRVAITNDYITYTLVSLFLLWITWRLWTFLKPRDQHSLRSVAIIVLGDIGRSPRMMYHAQSFAENSFITDIIGYGGSKPIPTLESLPRLQLRYLPEPPKILTVLPFVLSAPIKILLQVVSILYTLVWVVNPPEFILVQNPPTIPTLALARFVGRIRGSKVIIDWHNLGYSILALKLGNNHPFVKIATWFEAKFGHTAYAHLFVTQAMHDFLSEKWNLQGRKVVLHDRPPHHFHRSSAQEIHDLFLKLQPSLASLPPLQNFLPDSSAPYSTPFTHTPQSSSSSPSTLDSSNPIGKHNSIAHRSKVSMPNPPPIATTAPTYPEVRFPTQRPDRPALLVSSTSWTPDEDFGILLEAMVLYEARAKELVQSHDTKRGATGEHTGTLPKLLVILTGKGPLKEEYMKKVEKLQREWEWVKCISLWLEAKDYPILLGSADLGVCLHSSSSALDLPMKVVDMFGCGLPVCALDFGCLHELVEDGVNGLVFKNSDQLAEQLETLFTRFPDSPRLTGLRSSLHKSSQQSSQHQYRKSNETNRNPYWETWEESWGRIMRPLILNDLDR